jgi:uncharacterized protein YijF (DUF1287 family)
MSLLKKIFLTYFLIISFSCDYTNRNISQSGFEDSVFESDADVKYKDTAKAEIPLTILDGAKAILSERSRYDVTMGYYELKFFNGEKKDKAVYPGGDIDPSMGVCTDVIIRSLRKAEVVDLQEALHEDILKNRKQYPHGLGDRNIDHRRVTNLKVWFTKYWDSIDQNNIRPGDIVTWDLNNDGKSDHTGIVSDSRSNGNYFIIHNHQDPGYVAEEDKLYKWKITGIFRIKS